MTPPAPSVTAPRATAARVRKGRKRWPWVLGGLLLLGGVGTGVYLNRSKTETVTVTQTVSTATVQRGEVRISVSGPGTLESAATRTVGADLTATVGSVPAVGERLTKGQLVTTLSSDTVTDNVQTAQLNLSKAQASLDATQASQASSAAQRSSSVVQAEGNVTSAQQALDVARSTLQNQQALYDIGALSQQDFKTAQDNVNKAQVTLSSAQSTLQGARTQASTGSNSDAQNLKNAQIAVEQARAALTTAQRARDKLKVYAPISGVVSTVSATEGTVVTSGSTILTILDDTQLNLPVQIDETEISGVKVGQEAQVTLDAYPDQTFSGKVIRVSPGATQSSGISVFTATVALPNENGELKSGMTAEAEIVQSLDQGLVIPTRAIATTRNRSYVEVTQVDSEGNPTGEPERTRVQTGATDGTNTIVTDGLQAGQHVIVEGAKKTTSGSGTSGSNRNNNQPGGFGGPPPGGMP